MKVKLIVNYLHHEWDNYRRYDTVSRGIIVEVDSKDLSQDELERIILSTHDAGGLSHAITIHNIAQVITNHKIKQRNESSNKQRW